MPQDLVPPPSTRRRNLRQLSPGGEMADAEGLNPSGPKGPYGFESRPGHRKPWRVFGCLAVRMTQKRRGLESSSVVPRGIPW